MKCVCQLSVKCLSVKVMQSHRDAGMAQWRDGTVVRAFASQVSSFKFLSLIKEGMDMLTQWSFLTHGPLDQVRQPQHRDHPNLIE